MTGRALPLGLILASVALNAGAQVLLRLGARKGIDLAHGSLTDRAVALCEVAIRPPIVAGLACYGASILAWVFVLSRVEASFAYPFLGLGFVLVALAGALLLGEAMSLHRIGATALIVAGVVLLSAS